jgi:peptidoglycan/xylan/chitin deacetylase (PgdA/CDA1 family)
MAHGNPVAVLLESSGTGPMLRRTLRSSGLLVLNYHRIGDGRDSVYDRALWSATQDELDEQLRFLRRSFTIVSPGARMFEQARDHRRSIAITFDDGYRDNYELAFPVLREHGVGACFFLATGFLDRPRLAWWDEIAWIVRTSSRRELPSDGWLPEPLRLGEDDRERQVRALLAAHKALPVDRADEFVDWLGAAAGTGRAGAGLGEETWMTWDMAREMQAGGMVFGAHTVTHPVLSRCSPARQTAEIHGSLDRVREELAAPVSLFSYPDGQRDSFDGVTRACLRARDVELAFSFYGGRQPKPPDPLDVRRIGVGHEAGRALFRARTTLPRLFARETGSTREDELTGAGAGATGGLAALTWLAPATYSDLTRQLPDVLPQRHAPAIARS